MPTPYLARITRARDLATGGYVVHIAITDETHAQPTDPKYPYTVAEKLIPDTGHDATPEAKAQLTEAVRALGYEPVSPSLPWIFKVLESHRGVSGLIGDVRPIRDGGAA